MNKRLALFAILIMGALTGNAQPGKKAALRGSRPNIIFILADDMGYNDLGTYNNPWFKTPHIDALAAGGWKFTKAYVNAPNCAPSRACLVTGRFTPVHTIYTVGSSERGRATDRKLVPVKNNTVLDTSFYTLAEMLRDAGYECNLIGKWHLGEGAFDPAGQGFEYNAGGNNRGSVHSHFNYKKEIPGFEDLPDSVFLADAITEKAIAKIKQHRNHPYFLYLPYYSVHSPVQAPDKKLIERYKKTIPAGAPYSPVYAAMMQNLDDNVGKIIAAVKEKNELENTLIIFFSDNGPVLNYTQVDLRGEKGSLYEGGIKEPLIMSWKGHLQPGKIIDDPVSAVDFYPSFAALAGTKKQLPQLDGKSLLPLFENKPVQQKTMIWHFPAYLEANRKTTMTWRETPASAIREGKWKLVVHYETGSQELFDLNADPKETHNLYQQHSAQAALLKKKLSNYLEQTGAFVPSVLNPKYRSF
ncbi:sulfatase [Niabella hirudinis]|uniref:sulfatase n=1 Tax=Niabella hirudinis TaxID=1285929 RepID=UPI003EBDBA96